MKSLIVLLVTICIPALAYYHEPSMTVISTETLGLRKQALFGYSTTYQDQHRRLIVGAPRADNVGKIFYIDVNSGNIKEIQMPMRQSDNQNRTQDFWLGATVSSTNSYFITCAPRSRDFHNNYKASECYFGKTPDDTYLLPSLEPGMEISFNAGITTFGWSIASNSLILMGSPGSQKGGAILWNPQSFETLVYQEIILNKNKYPGFGYSVLTGKFLSDKTSYVISTTYGDYGQGKILFYGKSQYLGYALQHELSDGEVGSKYGAVMAAANLGGVRPSLIVGAPTYNEGSGFDTGAVYLYLQNYDANILTLKRIVTGTENGGYFGAAIVSVGDMDGDGLDEVAISAPYENENKGVVYLYSGAGLIAGRKWFQRIQPSGFNTFGLSLTAMDNFSDNGCKGIAIGAPDSNKVALFRGIPAITVTLFTTFPNLQKRQDKTIFKFSSGLKILYPANLKTCEANISVTIEVMHPSAKLANANSDGNIIFYNTLETKPSVINNAVKVFTPFGGYYDQEISYKISARLVKTPSQDTEFRPSQVMLSESSILTLFGSVSALDCEGTCTPNLKASLTTAIARPYISGSSANEIISITVRNDGETAYTSCLVLRVSPVLVLKTPEDCVRATGTEVLTCKPRASLGKGATWNTGDITLETSSLTNADKSIKIAYEIYDHCEKLSNSTRKHYEEIFIVQPVSDGIKIEGTSNSEEVVNVTLRDVEAGKRLEHIYKISNTGPTRWVGIDCKVQLPKIVNKGIIDIYVTVKTKTSSSNCSIDEDIRHASCNIPELSINDVVSIYVSFFALPTKLDNIIQKEDIKLNSKITLALGEEEKSFNITNTLHYNCDIVATWIIVLAVLFGLLLIAILIYVLYKCGFLQRKKKLQADSFRKTIKDYERFTPETYEETQAPIDDCS
ncbi:integrin alpha-4 [Pieris rapae]|uniref:integrin alpha-4 n=1 Tax=Pieris rapae TaxID=64459 RepID=UPI001E27F20B|nr:integrin alpha-4 [Pieris rapae]